jgi:hypothetical protein
MSRYMTEITPKEHAANLVYLVEVGEWDDGMHKRFHQSHWYDWTCNSVDNHLKYLLRVKRLMDGNATYAEFIKAYRTHMVAAKSKYYNGSTA